MIKQCAWCKRILVKKHGAQSWVLPRKRPDANKPTSHGLCKECLKVYFPDVYDECIQSFKPGELL